MASPAGEVVFANARQYARQPINLVLLALIPPLFIIAMSSAIGTFSDVLGGNLGERAGTALAGLWAASLLAGAATFFILRTSIRADGRLVAAGLPPSSLGMAHAATAVVLATLTTSVSFSMLVLTQDVADPLDLFVAILLAALVYAAIGAALAWFIEGDLEGSFVIILVFMLDAFVGGPLGGGGGFFAGLFPVHFPSEIAVASMLGTAYKAEWLAWSGIYLALLAGVSPLAVWLRGR
jgi:hypothetical protein